MLRDLAEKRWEVLRRQIGPLYESCTVKNFTIWGEPDDQAKQRAAVQKVKDYLRSLKENVREGRNVILYGPKGTGKDHLMTAMLRYAVFDGADCRWWDGLTLYAHLRSLVGRKESEVPLLNNLIRANVVAISDPVPPNGGVVKEHAADFLFRLFDQRSRKKRPIWVTANFATQKEAEDRTAPQIHDRLRNRAIQIPCEWPSYRRPEE